MATRKPATKTTKTTKATKAAATKPQATPTTRILKVLSQPEKPYRGTSARSAYWQRIQQYNGQDVAKLATSIAKQPPSQPKHGKLQGKTEPLSGWLSYFSQQGLITISTK
jgi:hypothetical protein